MGRDEENPVESMARGLGRRACAGLFRQKGAAAPACFQPPSENLCKLDSREVENTCVGAPVKALNASLSVEPFALMTSARTADAPDWAVVELFEATVRLVAAPEPG